MNTEKLDPIIKKIIKMYRNYGMDIIDMDEQEFERIRLFYKSGKGNIDADLKESEKFAEMFADDIIV